jgi:hypothetical protein
MSDVINSGLLTNKAKDLNDHFFLLLNEIVKIFPDAKMKPSMISKYDNSKTNKQLYEYSIGEMLKLQTEYFMFNNLVTNETNEMLKSVNELDTTIRNSDIKNKELLDKLNDLQSSTYSAEGLFDDAQLSRNQLLFGNVVLFLAISAGGYIGYKKIIQQA